MRRFIPKFIAATILVAAFSIPQFVQAQRAPGSVGIGFQIGDPSGVSLQFYGPEPYWDFLAAWDSDDFFILNVHALYERSLANRRDLFLFYGPGAFIGFYDRGDDDDVALGMSGTVGIGYLIEQFELFARITPRLSLVPDTDGDVGGGIGARYHF